MFKETLIRFTQFQPEEIYASQLIAALAEAKYCLFANLHERKSQFINVISFKQNIASQNKSWDHTNLFRKQSESSPYPKTAEEIFADLPDDLEAFSDEYHLGHPSAQYVIKPRFLGLKNWTEKSTTKETVVTHTQAFEKTLAETGKSGQRAWVETRNSQRLLEWVTEAMNTKNIPLGTKFVWTSLPGHKVERYPGVSEENHSFIWFFEVRLNQNNQREVVMTQYRCWPTLQQMQSIKEEFRRFQTERSPLLNKDIPFSHLVLRNQIIAEIMELNSNFSTIQTERSIYKNEEKWKVQRKDMPYRQRMNQEFIEQRELALNFLLQIYKPFFADPRLKLPYSDPFWFSKDYKLMVEQLDIAFSVAHQGLMSWVELKMQLIDLFEDLYPGDTNKNIPFSIDTELFQKLYTIQQHRLLGTATDDEIKQYNLFAPGALSSGIDILKEGQCGVAGLLSTDISKLTNSFSVDLSKTSPNEVRKASPRERETYAEILRQYQKINLKDKIGTQSQTFWVKSEYFTQYIPPHSYINDLGIAIGPCEIPLIKDENILTDIRYQEFFEASQVSSAEENAEALEKITNKIDALPISEEERQEIKEIIEFLQKRLIKPKISIIELLNDDLSSSSYAPSQFFLLINSIFNQDQPLSLLRKLLNELHISQEASDKNPTIIHAESRFSHLEEKMLTRSTELELAA